ncbi:MAG: sulfotransferase family 2 domain-containing protein [Nitrospira sp.]|nr:sulfotransferase family 2 domain-containing protein [Nitrospira sp.]
MEFNRELVDRIVIGLTLWHVRYFKNYVYIRIPKSGSTSVIKSLGIRMEHLSAGEIIQKIGLRSWEKKFSFTFVRNPYARAVSLYFSFGPGQLYDSKTVFRNWVRANFDPELYPYRTAPALRTRWNQVHWVGGDVGNGVGGGGGTCQFHWETRKH